MDENKLCETLIHRLYTILIHRDETHGRHPKICFTTGKFHFHGRSPQELMKWMTSCSLTRRLSSLILDRAIVQGMEFALQYPETEKQGGESQLRGT
jgi:hypothetical protein